MQMVLMCEVLNAKKFACCQLPDFSLRSQTSCYLADFSTTFLYLPKTKTFFSHPITKPPASTLKLKNFDFILQKLSVTPDKIGESTPTQLVPSVPGQAYDLR